MTIQKIGQRSKILGALLFASAFGVMTSACFGDKELADRPNIIIIYADDMGYGDLNCQNPESKIPTPNLDQLALEGVRFTDAHSSSGICSPSRFALLTGMYHWRRQHGIVGAFGKPFFRDQDITLANLLKANNYNTACIGKWHLGWIWEFKNDPSLEIEQWGRTRKYYDVDDIEWSNSIQGGPLARGFDYYFGDGTINFPPYAWIENDTFLEVPTEIMNITDIGFKVKEGNWEFRPGPKVKGWNPYNVLPSLTEKTIEWIGQQEKDEPYFLYFALPSPHAPIIPNDDFDGKSSAGGYGDFVYQTDWIVGKVLEAVKATGEEDNTLIIFSSDNGPESYAWRRARDYGHFSMGEFRGLKRDVWEGGHHVPLLVKWPLRIKGGQVSDGLVSQIDIFATLASLLRIDLAEDVAIDSYDFSPFLIDENPPKTIRKELVHNTYKEVWGIRDGKWLYINNSTGGARKMPDYFMKMRDYEDFQGDELIFNMHEDPGQRSNLGEKQIAIKDSLAEKLSAIRTGNLSVSK